jgi:hypothetical protein
MDVDMCGTVSHSKAALQDMMKCWFNVLYAHTGSLIQNTHLILCGVF